MDNSQKKVVAVLCLIACGVCLFVAFERYNSNSNNVAAMNNATRSMRMGQVIQQSVDMPINGMQIDSGTANSSIGRALTSSTDLRPGMPAATKYALLFAAITGIAAIVLLLQTGELIVPGGEDQKANES